MDESTHISQTNSHSPTAPANETRKIISNTQTIDDAVDASVNGFSQTNRKVLQMSNCENFAASKTQGEKFDQIQSLVFQARCASTVLETLLNEALEDCRSDNRRSPEYRQITLTSDQASALSWSASILGDLIREVAKISESYPA